MHRSYVPTLYCVSIKGSAARDCDGFSNRMFRWRAGLPLSTLHALSPGSLSHTTTHTATNSNNNATTGRTSPRQTIPHHITSQHNTTPQAILIPRTRFAPVKTTADLLALSSDAYEITPDFRMVLRAAVGQLPPTIFRRFTNFPPSH